MNLTQEQIEAVARIIAYETGYTWGSSALDHDALREAAIAAIAAAYPFIRAEVLEEAAKVADGFAAFEAKCFVETEIKEEEEVYDRGAYVARTCAAAIRALKDGK